MATKNIFDKKSDFSEFSLDKSNEVIKDTRGKVNDLKNDLTSENIETQEYNREKVVNMNIYLLKREYPKNWLEVLRKGMVYEINKFRQTNNKIRKKEDQLLDIKIDTKLNTVAQNHSKDIAENENSSHTNSKGEDFQTRLEKAGYKNAGGSENILMMTTARCNIRTSVKAWKESKQGHKENMLKHTTKIGIGYDESKNYESYFTAIFM